MDIEISEKQLEDLKMTWRMFSGGSPLELFFNHKTKPPRTVFTADENEFLQNTIAFNSQEFTCYFGLQDRRADLKQSGTNADISVLKWLYIDIDPVKPSKQLCSSDEEKALALEAARKITGDCISGGYAEPVLMDSGNGYWLFFRIPEIKIAADNWAEIAARLKAWGLKITGLYLNQFPGVDIDAGIYDLRRITKVPGTKIFNKNEAEGRPQRLSSLISTHEPTPDQKLYDSFMKLETHPIEEPAKPQEPYHQATGDKLHPERITEKCYTINFIRNKALSGVSLPHNIRLALSTIANGLDDLNHDLQFIRPILKGCPDYDETKTKYYLQQNVGKSAPYSCEKLKEIIHDHFNDYDPAQCNCNLPPHGKAKPSPVRYAYPSMQDMAEAFNKIQWNQDDSFQKYLQQKDFAGNWFQYFDGKECEEFLRAHKADQGLRVDTIKSLIKGSSETDDRSISDILIEIASDQAVYFKDSDGNLYAEMEVDSHVEIHPINGKGFETWLRREFYKAFKKGCSAQPMIEAILTIEAKYSWDCDTNPVYVRIGGDSKTIYIDLCNPEYEAVEITATGYQIIKKSPVKFRRSSGMMPLPYPVAGESLSLLREYLNLKNPEDWKLIAAFVVACARPTGPYPVLCLTGEQGSAKSTACRLIREIIDPSSTPLRQIPREGRDLMISAVNSWVLAFDNMSQIPAWLSDLMCRLATGGGMAIRTMYADMDETLFQATRPIILNGINSVTAEPDLADRSIPVSLATIGETDRKTELEILEKFNQVKPQIFGALCQAVSVALKNISTTKLTKLPRMADFALWATAAEPAYCQPGEFMVAYSGNRQSAIDESLASSPVMDAILQMTDEPGFREWEGTPTELLQLLNEKAGDKIQRSKSWPKEPNHLSRGLNKAAPQLRSREISIETIKTTGGKRKIHIHKGRKVTATIATQVEKYTQQADIDNENAVAIKNKLPPLSQLLPPLSNFTATQPPADSGGKINTVAVTMREVAVSKDLPPLSNNKQNQFVAGIILQSGDSGDKFTSFNADEIIPIFTTDPPKPRMRIKV